MGYGRGVCIVRCKGLKFSELDQLPVKYGDLVNTSILQLC